jgi:hypothetical protein
MSLASSHTMSRHFCSTPGGSFCFSCHLSLLLPSRVNRWPLSFTKSSLVSQAFSYLRKMLVFNYMLFSILFYVVLWYHLPLQLDSGLPEDRESVIYIPQHKTGLTLSGGTQWQRTCFLLLHFYCLTDEILWSINNALETKAPLGAILI